MILTPSLRERELSISITVSLSEGRQPMWSYSFEVPILMIQCIILIFYFSRPRLPLRRNRVFLQIIIVETLTIILDLSATLLDMNYQSYPVLLVDIMNMLYFIAFFVRSYVLYKFTVIVLKIDIERKTLLKHLIRIPFYIGILMSVHSMILGSKTRGYFLYYVDANGYNSGSRYYLLYIVGFFYIFISFVCSYLFRNNLGRRREKYAMALYNVIIFASLFIRLALPQHLIMDTFIFMAILIVYLAFINPEYFLDLKASAFNVVAFREILNESIEKSDLSQHSLGVVVRNYYEMRDVYGSQQLEEGLAAIGRYLKQLFPEGIVFYCRNGRFIVLEKKDIGLETKSKEIEDRFKMPWTSQDTELYLSAGFAIFRGTVPGHSADTILNTILKVLEKAGESEDGEIVYAEEKFLEQTESELIIRQCIEAAIEKDGFELYLQPIVDASTGKVIGAEALSRIKDLEGRIMPPGLFIPIAEQNGRINKLGEIVFDRTCKFIAENGLESMGIEWINVNLSPTQFIRTNLAEKYSSIADKYGIDPGKVHLEITEGSMIDDNFLQKQIGAMTEKGFKFVLDDYGTGYSNLARLKKCPFINVKLDMSIVWDFCKEPDAILPNMIAAFKHMGFCITAEGIEDDGMVRAMKDIGCDLLQGYHYSKPMPAGEFAEKYSV